MNSDSSSSPLLQTGSMGTINWEKVLLAVVGIGGLMAISFYVGHEIPVSQTGPSSTVIASNTTTPSVTPSVTASATPSPVPTASTYAGWQTYSNNTYNYSFKLPSTLAMSGNTDNTIPEYSFSEVNNTGAALTQSINVVEIGYVNRTNSNIEQCATDTVCYNYVYQSVSVGHTVTNVYGTILGRSIKGMEVDSPAVTQNGTSNPESIDQYYELSVNGKGFEIHIEFTGYSESELSSESGFISNFLASISVQ